MAVERSGRASIWKHRGKRFATGFNVLVSVFLALLVTGMVNYLGYRYHDHRDLSASNYYRLSEKTRSLVDSLGMDVDVVAFFEQNHEMRQDVHNLLKEYELYAEQGKPRRLRVRLLDPARDIALTREMKKKYELTKPNVVVFDCAGRKKFVYAKDVMDFEIRATSDAKFQKRITAFKGEQVFSSAIMSVTQEARPTVYFLSGHGERGINDYNEQTGYSTLAKYLRRDNMELKPLMLAGSKGVPEDCSLLVIAGADRKLSQSELDMLQKYLSKSGRALFLVDPLVNTGVDSVLSSWGIRLGAGVVVGLTITGRELVINQYGDHPVTKNLQDITTIFYEPRAVVPIVDAGQQPDKNPDKPNVVVVAASSAESWEELDLNQNPRSYDAKTDRRGPISISVAVEKGPVSDIKVAIKPTRLIVIGDSLFVSNGALKGSVGGNIDFFMSAMNWLLEREALVAIEPKIPYEITLDMSAPDIRLLMLVLVLGVPGGVGLIGFGVWLNRRF